MQRQRPPHRAVLPVDYARLAQRAYTDSPTIGDPRSASRMHVYGLVHVFRGTDDPRAALADIDIEPITVPGLGVIHKGFYRAWLAIRDPCMALQAPLAVAGHSLGAALAILCAAEWALRGVRVPVYAFEPPRLCCDTTMALLLTARAVPWYATRNGNDVVTEVPLGFTLPGPLTRIGHPAWAIDNVDDHMIARVIAALESTTQPVLET